MSLRHLAVNILCLLPWREDSPPVVTKTDVEDLRLSSMYNIIIYLRRCDVTLHWASEMRCSLINIHLVFL